MLDHYDQDIASTNMKVSFEKRKQPFELIFSILMRPKGKEVSLENLLYKTRFVQIDFFTMFENNGSYHSLVFEVLSKMF